MLVLRFDIVDKLSAVCAAPRNIVPALTAQRRKQLGSAPSEVSRHDQIVVRSAASRRPEIAVKRAVRCGSHSRSHIVRVVYSVIHGYPRHGIGNFDIGAAGRAPLFR